MTMSNQDVTTHKFVALLSKKAETGKAMNALAHMAVGLGASLSPAQRDAMGLTEYIDADGNHHSNLSRNSFVILRADNSNQIRALRAQAIGNGVLFIDFTNTMQEGTYIEQLERTKKTSEKDLEYYGICLFGTIPEVSTLTKKFQLLK